MSETRRTLVAAAALAAASFATSPTLAQDDAAEVDADQAAGRSLFQEGLKLYEAGNYTEACSMFERSLARYPGLGTRGKLAQCYEKIDKPASALEQYREVAELAGQAGQEARERVARDRAEALASQVPRLVVEVPENAKLEGLSIKVGDEALSPELYGKEAPYDPGTYEVSASAPNHDAWRQTAELKNYRSIRIIIPKLVETATPAPAPVPAAPLPVAPPPAAPPPPADEPDRSSERPWQMPLGIALTGVGAVALVVGGVVAGSASSTYDEAFETGECNSETLECTPDGFQKTEDAKGLANASTGLVIGGAVLAVTGVTLWATAPSSDDGAATAVRVGPGRLDVVGRF